MSGKIEHIEIGGVGIYVNWRYQDQQTGWTTKDLMEAFPFGCKVSLDTEGMSGRKDIGKVIGYWDDHVLIYNPENRGHSGGSFFEANKHLWKEIYSGKCWWFNFTRIKGVRKI